MTVQTSVRGSFARVVFAFDSRLRRRNGVFDYVDSPNCMLRAKLEHAGRRIVLRDGVCVEPCDRIIELHFRNEYFPRMGPDGATLAWARRAERLMDLSLEKLCDFLRSRGELNDISAIRVVWGFSSLPKATQFERIASRFGFEPSPEPDTLARYLRALGQNIVGFLLVTASNPKAAHLGLLTRREETFFVSRHGLEKRYRERRLRAPGGGLR